MRAVRTRFAPSPTGHLHVGGARTAILNWLLARHHGGGFVLRIEDTDRERNVPGAEAELLDDLRWLGLDWDEGPDVGGPHAPYLQSERQADYEAALGGLRAAGLVYPCFCSRREIAAAASAPHGPGDEGPRYPGNCRERPRDPGDAARTAALRFRVEPGATGFRDLLQGDAAFDPEAETGDFVVRRRDGVAAYQLAVVVDDAAMGITHVVRGADLLPSTARQLLLYRALGLRAPEFLHVPLMLGADGERLAKRHGAVSLAELREAGVAPARAVGWLASTCGLAEPGEEVEACGLIARFAVERLPRGPSVVDGGALERLTAP
ncbi:MAG TPA: tRNA glutamyl-Q(34) synthetase GluQRS [Longimicrobiaceae bacterium]|nr:tRNA glutamyl-Q(34) synthetase GluQRS [Longimicrobiaceae bacterium]